MKFIITGITGFAGPHLARLLLSEGHEVYGLIRGSNGREMDLFDVLTGDEIEKIVFLYGNFTDREYIAKLFIDNDFDGVFHLGAQSHPPTSFIDPTGTFRTNAIGTINLIDAIIPHNCKFMMCSTSEVYGIVSENKGPITEDFPIAPINPYGVSKAAADLYVQERARSLKKPFFCTRAFSHTGPRRGRKFSISSDAYQIAEITQGIRKEKRIDVGNLESRRVVMDVRDCVKAYYILMMEHIESGEVFNVAGDYLYSMGELLDKMLELRGLKRKVEIIKSEKLFRPIDIPVQQCSTGKLKERTGWMPTIPIEQTLEDLLSYWEKKLGDHNEY
jgi:GDP-4-dehydro-6-deoxy-D-mannose reductase